MLMIKMEGFKGSKPAPKKQNVASSSSEKSTKKSKKKKKSSRRRTDKENEKYSTSQEDLSDGDIKTNDSDATTQRTERETVDKVGGESRGLLASAKSHKRQFTQPTTTSLQLQPETKAYGEARAVKSSTQLAKVPQETRPLKPGKPSTNAENRVDLKPSSSQQSLASCENSKSNTASSVSSSKSQKFAALDINNESLRWEFTLDDSDEDEERIKQYKLNRRKRYLAAANQKYSDWLKTLNENICTSNSQQGSIGSNALESISTCNTLSYPSASSSYRMTVSQKDELVPGLGPVMNMSNPSSQVLLNS